MNVILLIFSLSLTFGGIRSNDADHRCTIDPNGGCVGGFSNTDGRSILDPIGGTATASSDRGAGLDPDG